jgi:hypothetical protein
MSREDKGRQKRLERAKKAVGGAEKSYKRYEKVKARTERLKPQASARKQHMDKTKSDLSALRKKIIGTPKTKASKDFSSGQETVLSKMSPDRAERVRSIVTKRRAEKRELAGLKKEVARERSEQHAKGKKARAQEAKGRFDKLSPSNKEAVRQRMAAKAGKARIDTGEPKEAPKKQRIDVGEPAKKKPEPKQRLRIATDAKKEANNDIEGDSAKPVPGMTGKKEANPLAQYNQEVVGKNKKQAAYIAKKMAQGISKSADVCKKSPPVCAGNKNVPRSEMPQLLDVPFSELRKDPKNAWKVDAAIAAGADPNMKGSMFDAFMGRLKSKGIKVSESKMNVGELKATQREIKAGKAFGMADAHLKGKYDPGKKPIVVSKDNFILDGHHRYAAMLTIGPTRKMNVIKVDMNMDDMLKKSFKMPGVFRADMQDKVVPGGTPKRFQESKGSTEAIQSTGTKKRRPPPPRKKRRPLPKPRNPNPFLKKGGPKTRWAGSEKADKARKKFVAGGGKIKKGKTKWAKGSGKTEEGGRLEPTAKQVEAAKASPIHTLRDYANYRAAKIRHQDR